ncbi:MAG: hypothetical protein KKE29_19990 [Proteobacteria bacterium]|nr:hypothetical protein [Pseudomonadota bacterium]MBU4576006.1 hypothetical protein [Pseudomonadota bacterium]MBV1715971.1 hypothetical protein [Desulfarculus sp.]
MCLAPDVPDIPEPPKYEPPKIEIPSFEVPEIEPTPPAPPPATPSALSLAKLSPEKRKEGPGRTAGRSTNSPTAGKKGTKALRIGLSLPVEDGPSGLQIPKG